MDRQRNADRSYERYVKNRLDFCEMREIINLQKPGGMKLAPVVIRNLKIGEGIPKICAPIVGRTKEDILKEAGLLLASSADFAEWRADWFEHTDDIGKVVGLLQELRELLKEMPLLFTFRTKREGGERDISMEMYADLNRAAAQSGFVDLIDVELFFGEAFVSKMITEAHNCGVMTVASNHDFLGTPDREEIIRRLLRMQTLGADILKIAVMPKKPADVLTLLLATEEMHRNYAKRPIITMSMSGMGIVSRLCGEAFGSAVTFGAASKASAPGQVGTKELEESLMLIHKGLQDI